MHDNRDRRVGNGGNHGDAPWEEDAGEDIRGAKAVVIEHRNKNAMKLKYNTPKIKMGRGQGVHPAIINRADRVGGSAKLDLSPREERGGVESWQQLPWNNKQKQRHVETIRDHRRRRNHRQNDAHLAKMADIRLQDYGGHDGNGKEKRSSK